jgi:hypothetical protein
VSLPCFQEISVLHCRSSVFDIASALSVAVLLLSPIAQAQKSRTITSPKQQFGHDIGDDYQLVNYTQETEYLQKLAKESDRMKLVDIGLTAEGRHQYMAIMS